MSPNNCNYSGTCDDIVGGCGLIALHAPLLLENSVCIYRYCIEQLKRFMHAEFKAALIFRHSSNLPPDRQLIQAFNTSMLHRSI